MYTYFLLHIATVAFPLLRSFEGKIAYYKKWKPLFAALFITASLFILWDHYFTTWGVWSFNKQYIIGTYILKLPVEEWLFFITVPFSCLFIYEALNYYIKKDYLKPIATPVTIILVATLTITAFLHLQQWYTSVTFFTAALCLLLHYMFFGNQLLGRFYMAYLVHLIPFFIINSVLTSLPIVIYNNEKNLGIRLGTIPIEDTIYSLILLLINISLYEYFKKVFHKSYDN